MNESSSSHFFRTTTGIQSRLGAIDESRFVMTFLLILWVTEILCSFRLVQEGKTDKETPKPSRLEFLEKFLGNNFALSDAKCNISGLLNRWGIADSPLLRTLLLAIHQKYREPVLWDLMDSFVLVVKISLKTER